MCLKSLDNFIKKGIMIWVEMHFPARLFYFFPLTRGKPPGKFFNNVHLHKEMGGMIKRTFDK